ncbi:MAG: hypothetical protein V1753_02140 [Pseudomonadota bacterium]
MIKYPKRLIEVDLPIKRISAHARNEKNLRKGASLASAYLVGKTALGRLQSH